MSDKVSIMFDGKVVECTPVQPGVVQKTASIFYVQDSHSKEWLYCSPARLQRLNEKYNGDLSKYMGRASKKETKPAPAPKAPKAEKSAAPATA